MNGVYKGDDFSQVYWSPNPQLKTKKMIDSPSSLNSNENTTDSNRDVVRISKQADELVITGAKLGDTIKTLNFSGIELKSIVVNNDVVKVKLTKHQNYYIDIGQKRYSITL